MDNEQNRPNPQANQQGERDFSYNQNQRNAAPAGSGQTGQPSGRGSRSVSLVILALIVGFGLGWLAAPAEEDAKLAGGAEESANKEEAAGASGETGAAGETSENGEEENDSSVTAAYPSIIEAQNQKAGAIAKVEKVSADRPFWAAVREDTDGAPGNILGAAWFPAGEHSNIDVTLLRGMEAGEKYYAAVYIDDGDKVFNHKKDEILRSEDGKIIVSEFRAN